MMTWQPCIQNVILDAYKRYECVTMGFEEPKRGDSAERIIRESTEDFNFGLFDVQQRQEVVARLLTARITTMPGSEERIRIDELLKNIEVRHGNT